MPVQWGAPVGGRCAHIGAQQDESVLADDLTILDDALLGRLVRHHGHEVTSAVLATSEHLEMRGKREARY